MLTKSRRSKRWTGRRRYCRCAPGRRRNAPHDYVRHGTSTLFAALDIATGKVTAATKPRHRRQEFLAFLKQVAKAHPDANCTWVMDNYAAHKTPEVKDWVTVNPRIVVHFTPTSGSWLNLVSGSGSSNDKPSAAAPSRRYATSTPRSGPSSTAGTNAADHSSGPNPPTTS